MSPAVNPALGSARSGLSISPAPTDEEAAAIVAALELAWPRSVVLLASGPNPQPASSWRWSGRWWAGGQHRRR